MRGEDTREASTNCVRLPNKFTYLQYSFQDCLKLTGGLSATKERLICYAIVRRNVNIVVGFLHAQRGEPEICSLLAFFVGKRRIFLIPGSYAFSCC